MHTGTVVNVLNDKDGKDKTFKVIQYSCKLILATIYRGQKQPRPITAIISQFSQFRKIIRLGNWLSTWKSVSEHKKINLIDLIDLYNEIFDDIYCLSRMGVVSNKLGQQADIHANYGWFLGILYNLQEEWQKYEKFHYLNTAVVVKLVMDLIFCGIDVFDLRSKYVKDIQTVTGFVSGLLSYYKLYNKIYDRDFRVEMKEVKEEGRREKERIE